jgi:hypothetical protein
MAEWLFEQVLAAMESQCHERMQDAMKTKEGFGIEYDENVACDVCRTVRVLHCIFLASKGSIGTDVLFICSHFILFVTIFCRLRVKRTMRWFSAMAVTSVCIR